VYKDYSVVTMADVIKMSEIGAGVTQMLKKDHLYLKIKFLTQLFHIDLKQRPMII